MKTPLGTEFEVDLGPGHIVLDGVPAPAKGTQQPPLFGPYVYCGHGRPSQLLLSSCFELQQELRPASADRTARRQFQSPGQPVSRTQAIVTQ